MVTHPVASDGRHLSLTGATGIGVGAIVGGGILALAGAAFALNGLIALLTACSFAELATAFIAVPSAGLLASIWLGAGGLLYSALFGHRAQRALSAFAADEVPVPVQVEVLASAAPAAVITRHAARNDLTILGLQRFHRRRKVFGDMVLHVARHTPGPLLRLSRRG